MGSRAAIKDAAGAASANVKTGLPILLTATIRPAGATDVKRRDAAVRLNDYRESLARWIADPDAAAIVFCENSGWDLSELEEFCAQRNSRGAGIEFLSVPCEGAPFGKGPGEMQILAYAARHSQCLREAGAVMKVTGRLYVKNNAAIVGGLRGRTLPDVSCDLTDNLTYAHSRMFYAALPFLENHLLPQSRIIDETRGVYFEHALARAVHSLLAEGGVWSMLPAPPDIIGLSGTDDTPLEVSPFRRLRRELYHRIKRNVIAR